MKLAGAIVILFGLLGFVNNESEPGQDAAYNLGKKAGPFLFLGLGAFLLHKGGAFELDPNMPPQSPPTLGPKP